MNIDYLLNLSASEKIFFLESMMFQQEQRVKYDEMRLKALTS